MNAIFVRLCAVMVLMGMVLPAGLTRAESLTLDPAVSLTLPDGWERANSGFASANAEVSRIFDCATSDSSQVKTLGWKSGDSGGVVAAFCVSFQKSGIGKMRKLLKESKGKEREAVAAKFLDSFAGKLKSEYMEKRKMQVTDLSADLLEAGNGFAVVMDGKVIDGPTTRLHSSTIYLNGDSLLRVSFIYMESAPASLVEQLDAIPLSVEWQ